MLQAVNFIPWKARIVLILQENKLWGIVNNTTAHPVTLESYLMPLKTISYHIFLRKTMLIKCGLLSPTFTKVPNENRKMVLREKLKSTRMNKGENMVSHLTRITQVQDEIGAVRERVLDTELVCTTLNGMTKPWSVFVEFIVAREHMPTWDRLWDDFI